MSAMLDVGRLVIDMFLPLTSAVKTVKLLNDVNSTGCYQLQRKVKIATHLLSLPQQFIPLSQINDLQPRVFKP